MKRDKETSNRFEDFELFIRWTMATMGIVAFPISVWKLNDHCYEISCKGRFRCREGGGRFSSGVHPMEQRKKCFVKGQCLVEESSINQKFHSPFFPLACFVAINLCRIWKKKGRKLSSMWFGKTTSNNTFVNLILRIVSFNMLWKKRIKSGTFYRVYFSMIKNGGGKIDKVRN